MAITCLGGQGQVAFSGATPTPLISAAGGQQIRTGVRIKALAANTDIIYFGFYASQSLATAGLTTSTGFPLSAGNEEPIDTGALQLQNQGGGSYGNLNNLYFLVNSGTQTIAYWYF